MREKVNYFVDGPFKRPPTITCLHINIWMHFDHFPCAILETSNFIVPVWRCPVRNITRKINGINSFTSDDIRLGATYCIDVNAADEACKDLPDGEKCDFRLLNPDIQDCNPYFRVPALSTCKADCPGGNQENVSNLKSINKWSFNTQWEVSASLVAALFSSQHQQLPEQAYCLYFRVI